MAFSRGFASLRFHKCRRNHAMSLPRLPESIHLNALAQDNSVMKRMAHLMLVIVFCSLLTVLTFDIHPRAAQAQVKVQPVRVDDRNARIQCWREVALFAFTGGYTPYLGVVSGCNGMSRFRSTSTQSSPTSSSPRTSARMGGLSWRRQRV